MLALLYGALVGGAPVAARSTHGVPPGGMQGAAHGATSSGQLCGAINAVAGSGDIAYVGVGPRVVSLELGDPTRRPPGC